jgi:hypothetical protein
MPLEPITQYPVMQLSVVRQPLGKTVNDAGHNVKFCSCV